MRGWDGESAGSELGEEMVVREMEWRNSGERWQ